MATDVIPFNLPIDLQRLELRNAIIQNLVTPPVAATGLYYYDLGLDTPGHFNSQGQFVPWDITKLAGGIPSASLDHSATTLGTTPLALGATVTDLAGMNTIASTTFTGDLDGNATTATRLQTIRQIGLTGVTASAAGFDGSADATIDVTAVPAALLEGAVALTQLEQLPALTLMGNNTAGVSVPIALTVAQVKALLEITSIVGDLTLTGDLLPDQDNVRSLGSATLMWKDIFVGPGSLYLNGQKILEDTQSGTIKMSADPGQNISIQTSATGDIELLPIGGGMIQLKGPIMINSGSMIRTTDGSAVIFDDPVKFTAGTGVEGGLTIDGFTAWHSGNLDPALKLDASAYTAADVLAKLLTVDGSGSGLDSDLLDGQSSAYYLDLTNATGTLALSKLAPVANHVLLGRSSAGTGAVEVITLGSGLTMTGGVLTASGVDATGSITLGTTLMNLGDTVTDVAGVNSISSVSFIGALTGTADNATTFDGHAVSDFLLVADYTASDILTKLLTVDGTGSGLDADTLDGHDSAYFQVALGYTPVDTALIGANGGVAPLNATGQLDAAYLSDVLAGYVTPSTGNFTGVLTLDGNAVYTTATFDPATKLDVSAYTAADVLAKLLTVDGTDSGLDADKLQGQYATYYHDLANATGALALSKLESITTGMLLGNSSGADSAPTTIAIGSGLTLAGGVLSVGGSGASPPFSLTNGTELVSWAGGAYITTGADGASVEIGSTSATGNLLALLDSTDSATWLCDYQGNTTQSGGITAYTATILSTTNEADLFLAYGNSNANRIYLSNNGTTGKFGINWTDVNGNYLGSAISVSNTTGSTTILDLTIANTAGAAGAQLSWQGNGTTTPNKTIRVNNGFMEWVNSAYDQLIMSLSDTGQLSVSSTVGSSGFSLGSAVAASPQNVSRHLDLYGGAYGLSVTGSSLNYVTGTNAIHNFINSAGTSLASIDANGWLTANALTFSGYATPPSGQNPGVISKGNGDSASFSANNMAIYSWNGIGFGPSITGQPIANGTYSHYFNVRTGDMGAQGAIVGSRLYAGWDSGIGGSVSCSNWFRATGNTGLYCSDYGGGIYMIDGTYLRSYNNKAMVASDFVISSDVRLKTAIRPLDYRGRLRPVIYAMKATGKREIGFIAQEVQELYPELVGVLPESGELQLAYPRMAAVVALQLNRLEDHVAVIEATVNAHTDEIARLSQEVEDLKAVTVRQDQEMQSMRKDIADLKGMILSMMNK